MKTTALTLKVQDWNKRWFAAIHQSIEGDSKLESQNSVTVFESISRREPCVCGQYTGKGIFPDEIIHAVDSRSVAVGAVIDAGTNANDEDLPVILSIGINYWQFGATASAWPIANWNKTNMRPRLDSALTILAAQCWKNLPVPKRYHLVAVNFFPWVTRSSWAELPTSLNELVAFHCWGTPGAIQLVADLILELHEKPAGLFPSPTVCFHGVNNAVSPLSLHVIDCVRSRAIDLNIMFTDNLGYGSPPRNAIAFYPFFPKMKRSDFKRTQDE